MDTLTPSDGIRPASQQEAFDYAAGLKKAPQRNRFQAPLAQN
jgi:hypothetical protein